MLPDAIRATLTRREKAILPISAVALTSEFAAGLNKKSQWAAFVRRSKLSESELDLVVIVSFSATL
jgi:hypothetical protein